MKLPNSALAPIKTCPDYYSRYFCCEHYPSTLFMLSYKCILSTKISRQNNPIVNTQEASPEAYISRINSCVIACNWFSLLETCEQRKCTQNYWEVSHSWIFHWLRNTNGLYKTLLSGFSKIWCVLVKCRNVSGIQASGRDLNNFKVVCWMHG